jgi:hypothetical protein
MKRAIWKAFCLLARLSLGAHGIAKAVVGSSWYCQNRFQILDYSFDDE